MLGNFNEEAQIVLNNAKKEMMLLNHPYVGSEHLVLSILKYNSNLSHKLNKYGLTYNIFREEIIKLIGIGKKKSELFLYTPLLKKIIESAIMDSKDSGALDVSVEHLFFALLEEGEGIAIRIFIGLNLDVEEMYDDFSYSLIKRNKDGKKKKLLIEELGVDLVEKARRNELDPVVGRDKEVLRLLEILCRRTKNNPLLIGEAGVGKTAIVEEVSRLIVEGKIPEMLCNKRIISLDMASAVAGTKYRGEFEERMKKILKEIEDNCDIILFIDEIHTLVGAGGAEGAIDASNILKPALARGKIRCIGATTISEYKKFIEKDGALDRRFQKIMIEEPNFDKTMDILYRLRPIYENYHNVRISDDVINGIIKLSDKYIYDRHQPDKAIDVMDEVCSKVSLLKSNKSIKIELLRKKIKDIVNKKNEYIIDKKLDKAYLCRKEEEKLNTKLNTLIINNKNIIKNVTLEDVAKVINVKTNIPVYEIMQDNDVIYRIKKDLCSNIIGQDNVINKLIDITKRIKLGYKDSKCYSMLFVGNTGVGKTLMAKNYAKNLVGLNNFIRLDMSEYSDSSSVNKILGSAPGYIGYDDDNNLLEEIRNKPYSVLLLDEIDKAHASVINLLYQILDEGFINDSKGIKVRFDNVIIVMTTNIGFEGNVVGFNKNKGNVNNAINCEFSKSFINRIDDIIVFNDIDEASVINIINNRISVIRKKYKDIRLVICKGVIDDIIDMCNYREYGARQIDKVISSKLENIIIDKIIKGEKYIRINKLKDINVNC